MGHTYTQLLTHVVFSTKERRPTLTPDIRGRLLPYLGGVVRHLGGAPLAINGVADHMHLLISTPAVVALSDFVGKLKANTSKWVHETFPAGRLFAWQSGYGAFSVSASQRDRVISYIEGQEEHHRKLSFQEEFLGFLKKHGIQFDERYVFD